MELNQKRVRDIMVPRSNVRFVYEDDSREEVINAVLLSGFTRLPVADRNEQQILGILHAKDLLAQPQSRYHLQPRDLMRIAKPVPESMRIPYLLEEFRRQRLHMAPVVDEYGGIAGIVTIEDIIEEIIGDIEDEHDKQVEAEKIQSIGHDLWLVPASIPLGEFNELLKAELEDKDAETLGGMVVNYLQRIPKRGQILSLDNFNISVKAVKGGRIQQLEVGRRKAQGHLAADIEQIGEKGWRLAAQAPISKVKELTQAAIKDSSGTVGAWLKEQLGGSVQKGAFVDVSDLRFQAESLKEGDIDRVLIFPVEPET